MSVTRAGAGACSHSHCALLHRRMFISVDMRSVLRYHVTCTQTHHTTPGSWQKSPESHARTPWCRTPQPPTRLPTRQCASYLVPPPPSPPPHRPPVTLPAHSRPLRWPSPAKRRRTRRTPQHRRRHLNRRLLQTHQTQPAPPPTHHLLSHHLQRNSPRRRRRLDSKCTSRGHRPFHPSHPLLLARPHPHPPPACHPPRRPPLGFARPRRLQGLRV